ncbi:MAG TPA: BrxE family protein [Firmicutes bacterium]|nr:BrxE family protein [Bacillota bacterium]
MGKTQEIEHLPELVVSFRAIVLVLGEMVNPPWWGTQFLKRGTGIRILEKLYPRTAFQAAIQAAGKAACEIHDQAIGRRGVFHLFRLPEALELEVFGFLASFDDSLYAKLRETASNGDKESSVTVLESLCGDCEVDNAVGPICIGERSDIWRLESYKKVAAVYLSAFKGHSKAYPYFEIAKEVGFASFRG